MDEKIAALTEENARLKQEIDEISNDLDMAANFGKSLLQSNKEYEDKLEEMSTDYSAAVTKIEVSELFRGSPVKFCIYCTWNIRDQW